jgi:hypothetical protein
VSQLHFARELDAIRDILILQQQTGEVYLYPHEVRENMRLAGMRVDHNLPALNHVEFDFDKDYEPDFGPELKLEEPITDDEPEEGDE